MTGESWYYDFVNMDQAVKQAMIKEGVPRLMFRYIKDIINTRVSMFSYDKIDNKIFPGLTSEIIEVSLMFMNRLCFYYSKALNGWYLCRYKNDSERGPYWKPKTIEIETLSGVFIGTAKYEDIVLVRDNRMDIIPFLVINEYINKIVTIENTLDKVLTICSLPVAIVGSKKLATSLKQVARTMGSPNPFIVGDDQLLDQVKSFDISVPVNPLDIYDLKNKYRNECMSSLGIYSVEEKRERIVTQELVNQNDYTDFIYMAATNERLRWVKEINNKANSELRLLETYNQNYDAGVEEKAELAKAVAKAEAEGTKEGDPRINAKETKQNE